MDLRMAVGKGLRKHLSSVQHEQFEVYLQRLLESRRRASLTSLRDRPSIEGRHFAESAAFLRALERAGVVESPVIDIGTGAGIPGPAPTLVLVRKAAETPERYPRRAGIPRKRPL